MSGSAVHVFWFGVVFGNEAIYGCLQVDDQYKDAALQSPLRKLGEEAFDSVEPGYRSWYEVEGPTGMLCQPLAVAQLSMMAWIGFLTATCASIALRKRVNSWCRWRCMLRPMMVPSRTLQRGRAMTLVWAPLNPNEMGE